VPAVRLAGLLIREQPGHLKGTNVINLRYLLAGVVGVAALVATYGVRHCWEIGNRVMDFSLLSKWP
jgi:hypothetical protein